MKIVPPSTFAAVLLAALLSGCSSWVYKADIQQGNIIDAAAAEKLSVGMDRRQVLFLLGSPAVRDPFHAERWDYVYYLLPGKGTSKLESLTVYFEDGKVARVERRPLNDEAAQG